MKQMTFTIDENGKAHFQGDMPLYQIMTCVEAYHEFAFGTGQKGFLKTLKMWTVHVKQKFNVNA